MPRRTREELPRFYREVTPTADRHRREDILREREHWDQEQRGRQRSVSPRDNRQRTRTRNSMDFEVFGSPPRNSTNRRSRSIEARRRHKSPVIDESSRYENKYTPPERYSDQPWEELQKPVQYSPIHSFQNDQPAENISEAPTIPEFNPETTKMNSKDWLNLIETTASERSWKQDEKLYIMTSRLSGYARQWYLASGIKYKKWSELREAFIKTFPSQLDYHTLLSKMMARVKGETESLSTYFLHKVALLNECEIQGIKAVSCIIAGLSNSKMRLKARSQKCEDPDQLYLYLRSLPDEDTPHVKSPKIKELPREVPIRDKLEKGCYLCGGASHVIKHCRLIKKHTCTVCHQMGHECKPLGLSPQKKLRNKVMEGSLAYVEVNPKNFTEVHISGIALKAYIDFESECITIKEETALRSRLPIKNQHKIVKGFAGSLLSSTGYIDTTVYIDRVTANARLFVVADNLQIVPVVIGQSFTQQSHVVILKDAGRTRFYQRLDNGQTNFDF